MKGRRQGVPWELLQDETSNASIVNRHLQHLRPFLRVTLWQEADIETARHGQRLLRQLSKLKASRWCFVSKRYPLSPDRVKDGSHGHIPFFEARSG